MLKGELMQNERRLEPKTEEEWGDEGKENGKKKIKGDRDGRKMGKDENGGRRNGDRRGRKKVNERRMKIVESLYRKGKEGRV